MRPRRTAQRWAGTLALALLAALLPGCSGCGVKIVPPKIAQGGRAIAISVARDDFRTILVASETGGLFRSVNAGKNWTTVPGLKSWQVTDVEVSPTDPRIVLATTRDDFKTVDGGGLWRSTDGGTTWTRPGGATPAAGPRCHARFTAWAVSFAPNGTDAYATHDCGIGISHDAGATWTHLQLDPTRFVDSEKTQNRAWSVVAAGGGRVVVASHDGLWTSADAGTSWMRSAGTPTAGQDWTTRGLAASPDDPDHLFLAAGGNKLFLSTDGGLTWTPQRDGNGPGTREPFVRVSRSISGRPDEIDVYFGAGVQIFRRTFRTGGIAPVGLGDWTQRVTDHSDPADIGFGRDGAPILLATDGGLHGTTDRGAHWTLQGSAYDGYNALQVTEITGQMVSGKPPHTDLYFGTQDNSNWASSDGGSTWPSTICCEGFYFTTGRHSVDHHDARVTGVTCGACSLFLTNEHFSSRRTFPATADPGPGVTLDAPVFLREHTYYQRVAFPGLFPGVSFFYVTEDDGAHWEARGSSEEQFMGQPQRGGPLAAPVLYSAVRRPGTTLQGYPRIGLVRLRNVFGPGDIVVETADGNGLRSLGTFPTMFAWYRVFGLDPEDPDHVLAPDVEAGEMKVTWDGGAHWIPDADATELIRGAGTYLFTSDGWGHNGFVHARAITFDPDNSCHILIGTAEAGILRSTDGGLGWKHVDYSERITNLSSIFFPDRGSLWVSSYGRSLWQVPIQRPARRSTSVGHGPFRCVGRPQPPLDWPPDLDPPIALWIDVASGARTPWKGLEAIPTCPECRWITVAWGRFTRLGGEDGLAVSGGVLRAEPAPEAAVVQEEPRIPPIDLRPTPLDAGDRLLAGLAGEGLSVRAVLLGPAGEARALVASSAELFTGDREPVTLQLPGGEAGGALTGSANGAILLGSGFDPAAPPPTLLLDGRELDIAVAVDATGRFSLELPIDLPPGVYTLEAVQRTADGLRAERTELRVAPADEEREQEGGIR
ncbi:MAG: hypothetical protein R2991_09075 [Thermoanaerobaculia bacterium]